MLEFFIFSGTKISNSAVLLFLAIYYFCNRMEKKIQDKELGEITLRASARACRYTLKISRGKITATMPVGGDEKRMLAFIDASRKKLLEALARHPARALLDETTEMRTATFRLHIFRSDRARFYMTLDREVLHIACPASTDFEREEVQAVLKQLLEKALRHEANRLLPDRLMALAGRHRFVYTSVKINNSRTHWGSCTTGRSINLSLSLMLLPWHLIDYVLLHELCHTVEMNHSKRFWDLLDSVTDGKALALRDELKGCHML